MAASTKLAGREARKRKLGKQHATDAQNAQKWEECPNQGQYVKPGEIVYGKGATRPLMVEFDTARGIYILTCKQCHSTLKGRNRYKHP